MKYEAVFGVDVCAYASVAIEADTDDEAIEKAQAILKDGMPVMEPAWETQDHDRIVNILRMDDDGNYTACVAENIELAPDHLLDNAYWLLVACKELLLEVEHAISQAGYDPNDRESIQNARAIIAVAEGRTA